MSGGTFRGTWETTRGGGTVACLGAGAVAAAAFLSWLATVLATLLWILAVLLAVFIMVAVPAVIWMRRWTSREHQKFNQQLRALPDEPRPAVTTVQPPVIQHFHGGTHLHLTPGAGSAGHPLVLPLRDAVTEVKEN